MTTAMRQKIKWAYVTAVVPPEAFARWEKLPVDPSVGDVGIFRVVTLGNHKRMEDRRGVPLNLFPGDIVACAFANRYATDQYEGYVPPLCDRMHLLALGGACGMVGSRNERIPEPTVLEFLGYALDHEGRQITTRRYRLRRVKPPEDAPKPVTILTVGASMNAGKTTTCAMAIRGLAQAGKRVVAAKLTGTGANKDLQFMRDAGAEKVLDFTACGHPSTFRLPLTRLLRITKTLRSHLLLEKPDYIVYEVADGIFQRETALLLQSAQFRALVDHVLFAAVDSMSAESAARVLWGHGVHLIGFSGVVSSSPLGKIEVERSTGLPCLSISELAEGGIVRLLEGRQPLHAPTLTEPADEAHYAPAPN